MCRELLISRLKVRFLPRSPNHFNNFRFTVTLLFGSVWLFLWLLLHHVFLLVEAVDDRLDLRGFGVEVAHSGV